MKNTLLIALILFVIFNQLTNAQSLNGNYTIGGDFT